MSHRRGGGGRAFPSPPLLGARNLLVQIDGLAFSPIVDYAEPPNFDTRAVVEVFWTESAVFFEVPQGSYFRIGLSKRSGSDATRLYDIFDENKFS